MKLSTSFTIGILIIFLLSSFTLAECYTGKIILKVGKTWKGYNVSPQIDAFIKSDVSQYKGKITLDDEAGGNARFYFEDLCFVDQASYDISKLSRAQARNVADQLIKKTKQKDFIEKMATDEMLKEHTSKNDTSKTIKSEENANTEISNEEEPEKEAKNESFDPEYDL